MATTNERDAADTGGLDPAPHGFYTVAELIERWGCGRTKAYQEVHTQGFPTPLRIGRDLRFARHEVWAYEATQRHLDAATPAAQTLVSSLPPARRPGPRRAS